MLPQRPLGKTGLRVGEVGLGAWQLGADWGAAPPGEEAAVAIVHAALEAGTDFIDTADIYGGGRSERSVRAALERWEGHGVTVATKMGRGEGWEDTFEAVERAAAGSAERLGVGVIDLVQLHCIPFGTLRAGRVFEHLGTLVERGFIRHYGASVETVEEGLFCLRETGCASLQVIFNLFRQRLVDELLPAAAAAGVGLIARVPLASGVLSGKFAPGHAFAPGDHRAYNADGQCFNVGETFAGVPFDPAVEFDRRAGDIFRAAGREEPLAALALRWVLDHPEISVVIPGASTPEQARANAAAAALPPLGTDLHRELADLYRDEIAPAVRGAY